MTRAKGQRAARRRTTQRRVWRAIGIGAVALALFAFTWIYRFNTLGGAFGGFDNDHFVYFAYAKQVQAGDRPLEDLDELGLQGWPHLTYRLSAAAQDLFGNTLRTEALLTIAATAVAAVATFAAAALLAPTAIAALSAGFAILVAPTLYNYPKVIVLGGGALLIVLYARRPSRRWVACLGVLAALAFAVRHDLAVYVLGGTIAVLLAAAGTWRAAVRPAVLYVIVTAALTLPSLIHVQRHLGVVTHIRNSLAMSRGEVDRTELAWPTFAAVDSAGRALTAGSFLTLEQNAVTWLYYVIRSLPLLAILLLWLTRHDGQPHGRRAALLALAVMLMLASALLLRGNVAVRFGDIGPLYAVVLASTLSLAVGRWPVEPAWRWCCRLVATAFLLGATIAAAWTVGYVGRQLETAGLSISWRETRLRTEHVWQELGALPAAYWSEARPTPFVAAVQYLHRCTAPADRVLIMPYWPELLPLADRRFAGGRSSVLPGFLTTEPHQRLIVQRWAQQSVPVALVDEEEAYDDRYRSAVPILHAYLEDRYVFAGRLRVSDGAAVRVFADRARLPAGVFGDTGLPCFH